MPQVSDFLYRKASAKKIPLSGGFELSPVCNFACKMCYVRRTLSQIEREGKCLRTWNDWLKLAKECKEAGTLYLLLTGGEPFLYPHFRELYQALHHMGFILSINTNGTMIDQETVEWLKRSAPSRINITLYGASAETYQRICGQPDGFERAKSAIVMLKNAGIPVVINASMIPENACDLERIIQFGEEIGVNTRVATYMFPPARRTPEAGDSRFTPEMAAEIYLRKYRCYFEEEEYLNRLKGQLQDIALDDGMGETWGGNKEYMRCRAGRSSFWISWEGTMTACGMLPFPIEEYPFEKPFHECWMELTDKVRTTSVLAECAGCKKRKICSPCVAMMYAETGNVNSKAPYLCEMTDCIIQGIKSKLKEGFKSE